MKKSICFLRTASTDHSPDFFATKLPVWKAVRMCKGQDSVWEVWAVFLGKLKMREGVMMRLQTFHLQIHYDLRLFYTVFQEGLVGWWKCKSFAASEWKYIAAWRGSLSVHRFSPLLCIILFNSYVRVYTCVMYTKLCSRFQRGLWFLRQIAKYNPGYFLTSIP